MGTLTPLFCCCVSLHCVTEEPGWQAFTLWLLLSTWFLAGTLGIEPRLTESKSVVLPLHNVPINLVEQIGFEPIQQYCPPGYSREPFLSGVYSIIVNALFLMRVLKHSTWVRTHLSLRESPQVRECFNTLEFFVSQKRLYPLGRPFAHVLSAG